MSLKIGQVILAFDGVENNINQYEGILHGKRYLIKHATTKEELLYKIKEIIPDLIIINTKTIEMDSKQLVKLLKETLPATPLIILGLDDKDKEKFGKQTEIGPFYIEYPINAGAFQSAVNKAARNIQPLKLEINGKVELETKVGSHFLMINEAEFVFGSTVKYFNGDVIELESDFFEKLGQRRVRFSILRDGEFVAKRQYRNVGVLQGACSKFQQKLKAYYVKNRGNGSKK